MTGVCVGSWLLDLRGTSHQSVGNFYFGSFAVEGIEWRCLSGEVKHALFGTQTRVKTPRVRNWGSFSVVD